MGLLGGARPAIGEPRSFVITLGLVFTTARLVTTDERTVALVNANRFLISINAWKVT